VEHRKPIIVPDIWDEDDPLASSFRQVSREVFGTPMRPFRAWMGVPLLHKERVLGTIGFGHPEPGYYTPRHARLALAVATHAAAAIENARLYAQAQQAAVLEERHRLARDLHDSVTQILYSVTMYAEAATRALAAGEQTTGSHFLTEVRDMAQNALREMRLLIFELRPPVLEHEGLVPALRARLAAVEARAGGIEIRCEADEELRPPAAVEQALYGVAQEVLNNVLKHARARRVEVTLRQENGVVRLTIADDGAGFDWAQARKRGGQGLRGMEERMARVGGSMQVETSVGLGTLVRVEVPV
jgi:signal transduction histidine kinase